MKFLLFAAVAILLKSELGESVPLHHNQPGAGSPQHSHGAHFGVHSGFGPKFSMNVQTQGLGLTRILPSILPRTEFHAYAGKQMQEPQMQNMAFQQPQSETKLQGGAQDPNIFPFPPPALSFNADIMKGLNGAMAQMYAMEEMLRELGVPEADLLKIRTRKYTDEEVSAASSNGTPPPKTAQDWYARQIAKQFDEMSKKYSATVTPIMQSGDHDSWQQIHTRIMERVETLQQETLKLPNLTREQQAHLTSHFGIIGTAFKTLGNIHQQNQMFARGMLKTGAGGMANVIGRSMGHFDGAMNTLFGAPPATDNHQQTGFQGNGLISGALGLGLGLGRPLASRGVQAEFTHQHGSKGHMHLSIGHRSGPGM